MAVFDAPIMVRRVAGMNEQVQSSTCTKEIDKKGRNISSIVRPHTTRITEEPQT